MKNRKPEVTEDGPSATSALKKGPRTILGTLTHGELFKILSKLLHICIISWRKDRLGDFIISFYKTPSNDSWTISDNKYPSLGNTELHWLMWLN